MRLLNDAPESTLYLVTQLGREALAALFVPSRQVTQFCWTAG
jgi:hypothetical protein